MKQPVTFTTDGYRPGSRFHTLPSITLHEPGLTDNHRIILTTFFRLQALLQGYKQVEARRPDDVVGRDMATLWSLMREAHIFEFPSQFQSLLYHEADVYTVEHVIGAEWSPAHEVTDEERRKIEDDDYLGRMDAAGRSYPYPEKLPFSVNFLAWGGGAPVPPLNRVAFRVPDTVRDLTSFGVVVTQRECWEIMIGKTDVKTFGKVVENLAMVLKCHYVAEGGWDRDSILSLAPWMVGSVMGAINDNESFIESHPSSLWDRQTRARFIKKEKRLFIPRPYYTVTIKPQHVKERMIRDSLVKRQIELSYRYDRRGNFASRVMRGKLSALTDKVRKKLLKRKYKIWTRTNMPDAEAMAILMKCHQSPPALDEWVATLRWWRSDTVVGKEELPYIPSTRKLAKGDVNKRG